MATTSPALELIQQKAEEARKASTVLRDREVANAMAAEAIISEAIDIQGRLGAAQRTVTSAQAIGTLEAQEKTKKIVELSGADQALFNLISQTAKVADRTSKEIQAVREEQLASTGFSPIAALKLALDTSGNQTRLEQSMKELQFLQGTAAGLANQVTQAGHTAKATSQTVTAASAQASADIVELQSRYQAQLLRLEGLKYNTQGIQAVAAASDRDLKLATDVANFGRAESQYQLALEEEARRREQFDWQKEMQRAARDEKISEREFEERTVQYIQLGQAARGVTPESPQMIKDLIKLNKGLTQEYVDLYKNGEIASRTGQGIIAETPAKVLSILSRDPTLVAQLPEQQKKVAEILLNAQAVLSDKSVRAKEGLDEDKTGAKSSRVVTQAVQTQIQRQLSYVGNNPDNVFYIGEPSSYIGSKETPGVSTFQRYPLTDIVFNPAIEAGVPLSDVSVPWKLTLEAVKAGKINSSQAAADFSQIYKRMSALHRAGVDFKKFAIALPPDGSAYRVKIGGEIIDVTDFTAVARAMNAELARQAYDAKPLGEKLQRPFDAVGRISGSMK